jgi:hypothetical protein
MKGNIPRESAVKPKVLSKKTENDKTASVIKASTTINIVFMTECFLGTTGTGFVATGI